MKKEQVIVCTLGRVPYEPAWNLQKKIQQALITAKRTEPPISVPHIMLLVEHPPVFTLGKSGNAQNLLVSESLLALKGASFVHIDRGGDITYHGPGQLVGYPILDLDRISPDIHLYLRNLEEVMIRVCNDYHVAAGRVKGKTGVWIDYLDEEQARKICAMGIRCSRWVTMHGFALNLNTDLSYFDYIVPCGIKNRAVTSLARELNQQVEEEEIRTVLINHFADVFDVHVQVYDAEAAFEYLETLVDEPVST